MRKSKTLNALITIVELNRVNVCLFGGFYRLHASSAKDWPVNKMQPPAFCREPAF